MRTNNDTNNNTNNSINANSVDKANIEVPDASCANRTEDETENETEALGGRELMKLFSVKLYRKRGEVLVAVADAELVGKTFRGNGLKIEVSRNFYHGELLGEDAMVQRLKLSTIANLVGKRCVAAALKYGFVGKESIIHIGKVPHAQIVCMTD